MEFNKKILFSYIISTAILITSLMIPIIPCKTSPAVPNPILKWSICDLNPDTFSYLSSTKKYWGYTTKLLDTYLITLILIFFLSLICFHFFTRKQKK